MIDNEKNNEDMEFNMNLEIVSDEELSMFQEFELEKETIKEAESLNKEMFYKKVNKDTMEKVKKSLEEHEKIEFYFTGADVEITAIKAATFLVASGSGVTSTDWAINKTVVFTNKKIFIVQRNNFLQYLKHEEVYYENINKVHLYKKNRVMEIRYNEKDKKYIEYPEGMEYNVEKIINLKENISFKKSKGEYLQLIEKLSKIWLIVGLIIAAIFIATTCIPVMF